MTEKIGIICGGRSGEHQVSLMSALGVSQALDPKLYQPLLLAINQQGQWHIGLPDTILSHTEHTSSICISAKAQTCLPVFQQKYIRFLDPKNYQSLADIATFFPLIHGTDGEDGILQGWLNLADVAFVGADVAPSAICIDKELTKKMLTLAKIPSAPWLSFQHPQTPPTFEYISQCLASDVFIKPARLGSSVGIQRVQNNKEYQQALASALQYDYKIIIEKTIKGRELECSVLGSHHSSVQTPIASPLGEIKPQNDFYSYRAKYLVPEATILDVPAQISTELSNQAQNLALKTFQALDLQAMARVDLFLTPEKQWFVNEVNTIPGFTPISMYPKLLQAHGIPYQAMLHILIQLAKEYHQQKQLLQRNYS